MARYVSKGTCAFCRRTIAKSGMTRHLAACDQRKQAEAAPKRGARPAKLFHLVVEGRDLPMYWLHLAVPTTLLLSDLDAFLRAIWLECCGHLSAFEIDRRRYLPRTIGGMVDIWEPLLPESADATPLTHEIMVFGEGGELRPVKAEELQSLADAFAPVDLGGVFEDLADADMDVALGDVLAPGKQAFYEYDFGTTTNLTLKVVAEFDGWTTKREPVRILARNDPPEILCDVCQQPAASVCAECVWNGAGWLCQRCGRKHPCGEEMLLPVVNSPRVGMCGYTG
jgi:hypothetical protein